METNRAFYLGIVFLLLAVDSSHFNWKVNVIANSEDSESKKTHGSNEQDSVSSSVSDSNLANKGKKNKVSEVKKSKNNNNIDDAGNTNNNNNSKESGESGSLKTDNLEKESDNLKEKPEVDAKKKKIVPKENGKQGDSGVALKDSQVEECDPSNKCTDDENNLVACLRVPGNDPQYSLLIQNKGKKPLTVTITAPDFVQLEKKEIQLQAEGNQKVEVSIGEGGSNSLIVLKAGKGHCNLDIKHLISENSDEVVNSQKFTYINFMTRTRTIVVLSFAVLLILAAGWTCISFRRKQLSASGSKYQRIDMDLPVSGGGKAEPENNEGWDNSWGDDWDDEEAPKTSSMPVTPSLSSKGLASRRLIKEGWKD